jgi:hypothetical protein
MALTQRILEDALAAGIDKVPAPENSERFRDSKSRSAEQAKDVKTTNTSRIGDVGIRISLDSNGRTSSKRKTRRLKVVGNYMCFTCGTSDSPEWRRGPKGPKTLCNACGCKQVPSRNNSQITNHDSALDEEPKERPKRRAWRLPHTYYQTLLSIS